MSREDQFTEIYSSNNKADVTAKKGLLESNGIPCSVRKEADERYGSAWGMPLGMEDSLRRFALLVAPENAGHAEEILVTAPAAGLPQPHIVLLDREHNVAVQEPAAVDPAVEVSPTGSSASEQPAFPREAIEEATDQKLFNFLGEFAENEGEFYQFFISPREAESIRMHSGYTWKPLRHVLSAAVEISGGSEHFRRAYCEVVLGGYNPPAGTFGAFGFGSTPKQADRLGNLVRDGEKRAAAGLVWSYETEGESQPRPGDVGVIVDGGGKPTAVIETTAVEVLPFNEVPAEFAAAEGEGDKSLEYWRKIHWKAFRKECRNIGREPSESMPVVCERFRVLQAL